MKSQILKTFLLLLALPELLFINEVFSQTPAYTLTLTNDQQVDDKNYEFDIYLLCTSGTAFEYANNSQYFININPAIINSGSLTFTIIVGTCELNNVQQIQPSKVSFDAVNNRLRIAAHSPSGAGTGTIISNGSPGTRLGRFRVTNTVTFTASQANLSWYNGPSGFFTKVFAYVGGINAEITNAANHLINVNNNPLPVMLSSFNYTVIKNDVKLMWITEREINNRGFDVERKNANGNWEKTGFIIGSGTTAIQKSYSYEDKKLETKTYKYRLKQIDYNGNFEYFNLQNDIMVGKPGEFNMFQNYPNPSNPKSKIDYDIPFNGKVSIKVYNIIGQEVLTILEEFKEAGYYTSEFDGTNISSGVYFYRIIAEGNKNKFSKTMKMVIIK